MLPYPALEYIMMRAFNWTKFRRNIILDMWLTGKWQSDKHKLVKRRGVVITSDWDEPLRYGANSVQWLHTKWKEAEDKKIYFYWTIIWPKSQNWIWRESDIHYLSIVDMKIVFKISGILFVSRQTKPLPEGSFFASRSAWSPSEPMKMAKASTSLLRFKILAKFDGEIP